nr:MAG TPA: hypothetical protein [Caudoviricetes sp.]
MFYCVIHNFVLYIFFYLCYLVKYNNAHFRRR